MRNVCTFKWNDPLYPLLGNYFTNGITLLPNRIKHSWIIECDHFVLYWPFWYQSIPNHLDVTHCSQGYVGTYVVNSFLSTDEISFLARACLPCLFRAKRKKKCHAKKKCTIEPQTFNSHHFFQCDLFFVRLIYVRSFFIHRRRRKTKKKTRCNLIVRQRSCGLTVELSMQVFHFLLRFYESSQFIVHIVTNCHFSRTWSESNANAIYIFCTISFDSGLFLLLFLLVLVVQPFYLVE